jgi:hypothetical protein
MAPGTTSPIQIVHMATPVTAASKVCFEIRHRLLTAPLSVSALAVFSGIAAPCGAHAAVDNADHWVCQRRSKG